VVDPIKPWKMSNEGIDVDIVRREGRDEARRDATTRQLDNDKTRGMMRDEMQRNDRAMAMQQDGTHNDKGQRDNTTTNQTNNQMDEQTNKAGAT
jgi:hypothetical protein